MSERTIVGLTPWLPRLLANSAWWTEPVRAERLAALRIGIGAMMLLDVLWTYWPQVADFFGTGSLGSPEVFAGRVATPYWRWSLLRGVSDAAAMQGVLVLWAAAAFSLMVGLLPRLSALVCWALAVSVFNLNYYLHNSGDNVRSIALFYLIFCPSAAAWSVTSWWQRRSGDEQPVYISPWPLRLLFVQLVLIYFFNGLHKLTGPDWRSGEIMYHVMGNLGWTRLSSAQAPMPSLLLPVMTYTTLLWELFFPLLVCMPAVRKPALWLGVLFHVGTGVLLQLTMFPFYMLCLYLPLVPWETYVDRWRSR